MVYAYDCSSVTLSHVGIEALAERGSVKTDSPGTWLAWPSDIPETQVGPVRHASFDRKTEGTAFIV